MSPPQATWRGKHKMGTSCSLATIEVKRIAILISDISFICWGEIYSKRASHFLKSLLPPFRPQLIWSYCRTTRPGSGRRRAKSSEGKEFNFKEFNNNNNKVDIYWFVFSKIQNIQKQKLQKKTTTTRQRDWYICRKHILSTTTTTTTSTTPRSSTSTSTRPPPPRSSGGRKDLPCRSYIALPVSLLESWSTQRANDRYKDHLDGQLTAMQVNFNSSPHC